MRERQICLRGFGYVILAVLLLSGKPAYTQETVPTDSQASETQQLKDKLQSLEKSMEEVKEQLKALESRHAAESQASPATPQAVSNPAIPQTTTTAEAQVPKTTASGGASSLELYGHVMLDSGYNFGQTNPNWFDVLRPTQLPSYTNEFGPDGSVFFGVRQTRFGVKTSNPTRFGDLKTVFEFELFGTGVDAGQTTFRLRHAYGELGQFGAGQYWSPFMDIDVFPNTLEYWGPNGMVFFRNVQFRWMPIRGKSHLTFAVERPGASADQGVYANRIELEGVKPKFDLPDFSMDGRIAREWGFVEGAAMFRKISWVDLNKTAARDLSGTVFGWGVNLSSNLYFTKKDTGRFQIVYGHGVENYMNDAPVDVGIKNNFSDPHKPIVGVALPVLGAVAFLDHTWNERFTSSGGWSLVHITNSNAQNPSDFREGQYGLANLLYHPVKNAMMGGEFQWGRRRNYTDGFSYDDYRLQFSVKYNFSKTFSY